MLKKYLFILLFPFQSIMGQSYDKAIPIQSYENVLNEMKDSSSTQIYEITEFELDTLIQKRNASLNLIYIFSAWCGPCREKLPSILKMADQYSLPLFIVNDEENGDKKMGDARRYLEKMKLNTPSFAYDFGRFAGKSRKKQYEYFQKLTRYYFKASYNDDYMYGYTSFILVDQNAKLIYANSNTPNPGKEEFQKLLNVIEKRINK